MTAKEAGKKRHGPPTIENRRARHEYRIEDTVECGLMLKGAEVKSLRAGKVNLQEAHARVHDGELWLHGMNVTPYSNQNTFERLDPLRERKLLAHKKQIEKLEAAVSRKGYTLVPLKIYFVKGFAKVLIGVGEGKKLYDKREDLKQKAAQREIDRARKGIAMAEMPAPDPSWSDVERRAWKAVATHGRVDLTPLPESDRRLSSAFVRQVTTESPYAERIGWRGSVFVGARFDEPLSLNDLSLNAPLLFDRCRFGAGLYGERLTAVADLRLRDCEAVGVVNLRSAKIGGLLELSGLSIPDDPAGKGLQVTLTGATVKEEFMLARQGGEPNRWSEGRLVLLDTAVGGVVDHHDAWPPHLELNGFTYSRLGRRRLLADGSMADREVAWLVDWLARQAEYSPRPYQQLATALVTAGHRGKADGVLYQGELREHREVVVPQSTTGMSGRMWWIFSWMHRLFTGYGYRNYHALLVALFLFALGVVVLQISGEAARLQMEMGGVDFSLDMILPIIKLHVGNYETKLHGWVRYYFYFHQIMGHLLALFLLGGLRLLSQRR